MGRGGAEGIAVATLGEAEVFAGAGFSDIMVASQIVTRPKIARLCALASSGSVSVAVDNPRNVAALSGAAAASGVRLAALVEIDLGLGRCGVAPGAEALELAKVVSESPGLLFEGILAVPPVPDRDGLQLGDKTAWDDHLRGQLQPVLDTRELLEREGLTVWCVSVAGTHNYDVAASLDGIDEVQAGSYPLMDYRYRRIRPEFGLAARVLASVISHPTGQSAVLDAGHKATGPDRGTATLEGVPGAAANRFSAEHGVVELDETAAGSLRPGDKAWLAPNDLALCLNQYDYVRAARNGKLEGYWPIAARGRFA